MRLTTGKNREIRKIMEKFSLRVNRLQRVKYGSYALGNVYNVFLKNLVKSILANSWRLYGSYYRLSDQKAVLQIPRK